ncbi:MAG: apolipoprotein N-acyltransferase [Gammaproteobacteria bacterium]|nr:apolipoprotein N-acyltransferase [Gammaproteobacteria bacterium]
MSLSHTHPGLIAVLAGILTTGAFAPFAIWPLAILGPALLFQLWLKNPGGGFRLGFFFGLGMMGTGVTWLHVSIAQFGNIGWFLPILITLVFVVLMALYYGLLGWLSERFETPDRLKLLGVYPALWVLVEWFRGWFLSGFPWLELGHAQIDTPLAGFGPLLGGLGVSYVTALSAGLGLLVLKPGKARPFAISGLMGIWLSGWGLLQVQWSQQSAEPIEVALVQGNIPQEEKWELDQLVPSLTLYARLTKENLGTDLIVWPETAVSAFQHQVDEAFLQPLEQELKARGTELVFGVVRLGEDGSRYYNSMVSMGKLRDHYSKRHLVPFTEYLPWKPILTGLVDFFTIPMSDFTPGSKPKPLMRVGEHQVGMSICYEDAFGTEMAEALPEAAYLINASNDAWFGRSLAPHQHLQIARMRALETSRYLLRATNTGISAIVGPDGALLARTPLMQETVLKGEILPMSGITPFARFGNLPILALLSLGLVIGFPCASAKTCGRTGAAD